MSVITPGQITAIYRDDELLMGCVDFGGVSKEICLGYLPEAQVGQYVLVHAGFAISVLAEAEAANQLSSDGEVANLETEL